MLCADRRSRFQKIQAQGCGGLLRKGLRSQHALRRLRHHLPLHRHWHATQQPVRCQCQVLAMLRREGDELLPRHQPVSVEVGLRAESISSFAAKPRCRPIQQDRQPLLREVALAACQAVEHPLQARNLFLIAAPIQHRDPPEILLEAHVSIAIHVQQVEDASQFVTRQGELFLAIIRLLLRRPADRVGEGVKVDASIPFLVEGPEVLQYDHRLFHSQACESFGQGLPHDDPSLRGHS
mmetsp:Transcript_121897/g.351981  ORF Transcript_121897/g.351981 Transcript_121897/m.351981 type:complete len:237 (-) Transcript_121897:1001-1711(-)